MPGAAGSRRAAPSRAERAALAIVGIALVGFAIHGYLHQVSSTTAYLGTVLALGALVLVLRRDPLPDLLAYALALDAVAHLCGGLLRVGHGVLYNAGIGERSARLGTHLIQGDHVIHTYGTFVATMAAWVLVVRPMVDRPRPGLIAITCLFVAMGVGAANELVEFVVTLLNRHSHVGGYSNTGWDLVANAVGASIGAVVIWRIEARHAAVR